MIVDSNGKIFDDRRKKDKKVRKDRRTGNNNGKQNKK